MIGQGFDMNTALMVDGNAIAGELVQIFGRDMTTVVTRCSACAADSAIGELMNFMRGPGAILRCPSCQAVIVRIVRTPTSYFVDVSGAIFLRFARATIP